MKRKIKYTLAALSVAAAGASTTLVSCGNLYEADKYKITFVTNGGTSIGEIELAQGNEFVLPKDPTRTGYTFEGWYLDEGLTNKLSNDYVISGDVIFYAKWSINSYTVSFNTNGGTTLEAQTLEYNSTLEVTAPTKEGYEFAGWYTDEGLTSPFSGKVPASNVTLYAKWATHVLTVTFDKNSEKAEGEMVEQIMDNEEAKTSLSLSQFTRLGYTFKGWGVSPNGPVVYQDGANLGTISETKEITLYAIWEANVYDLSFVNGYESFYATQLSYEEELVFPASSPAQTGYTFKGWGTYQLTTDTTFNPRKIYFTLVDETYRIANVASNTEISGEYYELIEYTGKTLPLNGLKLYAIYERNEYSIKFETNGGNEVSSISAFYNSSITKPTAPSKEGYTFAGWYSDEGLTKAYNFSTMPAEDITLYAKWTVNQYTFTFEVNGGSAIDALTLEYNSALTLPQSSKQGYDFEGWYSDKELTTKFTGTTVPAKDVTLYAKWVARTDTHYTVNHYIEGASGYELKETETLTGTTDASTEAIYKSYTGYSPSLDEVEQLVIKADGSTVINLYYNKNTYTVTFIDAENNNTLATKDVKYNNAISTLPSDLVKTGYEYSLKDSEGNIVTASTLISGNTNVYVTYTPIEVSITFNRYDEVLNPTISSITEDYGTLVKLPTPVQTGYSFVGWYTSSDFTGAPYAGGQEISMPAEHLNLYAKFEINEYSISFNSNGGSVVDTITQDYNSSVTAPSAPSKEGYTFAGWYSDKDLTKAYNFSTMPAENITLYAKWTVNQYTFTFVTNGGSAVTSITQDYGTDIVAPTTTKTGYTFVAWYTDEELNDLYTFTTVPAENITLYAKWEVNSYTYKFYDEDGTTLLFETTLNYGSSYVIPSNPTKATDNSYAYVFAGWVDSSTNEVVDVSSTIGASDKIYKASYTSKTYTVKWLDEDGGSVIISRLADGTEIVFTDYVEEIYNQMRALDIIGKAMDEAIEYSATNGASGSTYPITYVIGYLSGQITAEQMTASTSADTIKFLDVFKSPTYLDNTSLIPSICNFSSDQNVKIDVSNLFDEYSILYKVYKTTAYVPYSDEAVFDGWGTIEDRSDLDNIVVYYYAKWVSPIDTPTNIKIKSITSSSVTFSWNEVTNAYGYEIYVNNVPVETIIGSDVTTYKVNELSNGDNVSFYVVALSTDSSGNVRNTSNTYSATSFEDGSTITSTAISLKSTPSTTLTYTHVVNSGAQDITASGDYYYRDSDGTLYLFANSSYTFSNVTQITITSGGGYASVDTSSSTPALITGSAMGNIKFTVIQNGVEKEINAVIYPLVSSIDVGDDTNSFSSNASTFLNTNATANYLIGAAVTSSEYSTTEYINVDAGYYNGFKFDFAVSSTSGLEIDSSTFDLDYTFYKWTGSTWEEVTDPSTLYVYDEEADTFYFLQNSGQYKVRVSYKKDVYEATTDTTLDSSKTYYTLSNDVYTKFTGTAFESGVTYYELTYLNTTIPNAYKSRTDIYTEFEFELNEGINVFTNEGLKSAFENSNTSSINIHRTITAELAANEVAFAQFLVDNGNISGLTSSAMSHGDVDIVDGSAIMVASSNNTTYGPNCWKKVAIAPTDGTFYFSDKSGNFYVYEQNGGYSIKSCKWKQNFDEGKFKIINKALRDDSTLNTYGLDSASLYTREGSAADLTVNGNYFSIDGSKLPFIVSASKVPGPGTIAAYEIQNIQVAIFETATDSSNTTFSNLGVISNTQDASAYLNSPSSEISSIADYMSMTSGGYNAFKSSTKGSSSYNSVPTGSNKISLSNVNIKNSLIALFVEYNANFNADYTYVTQTWANSLYSNGGNNLKITNSKIESSGGAAFHVQDIYYTYDGTDITTVTNPTLQLETINTTVENYVSGEEQWFKAYGMEVTALGMKSQLEAGVSGTGYTILKTVTDPNTGLQTEKMNFVYFGMVKEIDSLSQKDKIDAVINNVFGTDTGQDSNGYDVYVDSNGSYFLYKLDSTTGVITIVPLDASMNAQMDKIQLYLFFSASVGSDPVYGIVQMFSKS